MTTGAIRVIGSILYSNKLGITQAKGRNQSPAFEVRGIPVVITGDILAEAIARLPEGTRDVILLSFLPVSSQTDGAP